MLLAELLALALPATDWVCLDVFDPPEGLAGQGRWAKFRRFDGKTLSFADRELTWSFFRMCCTMPRTMPLPFWPRRRESAGWCW